MNCPTIYAGWDFNLRRLNSFTRSLAGYACAGSRKSLRSAASITIIIKANSLWYTELEPCRSPVSYAAPQLIYATNCGIIHLIDCSYPSKPGDSATQKRQVTVARAQKVFGYNILPSQCGLSCMGRAAFANSNLKQPPADSIQNIFTIAALFCQADGFVSPVRYSGKRPPCAGYV